MSSTRSAEDYSSNWETPGWAVRRLIEEVDLPTGSWLEPNAGPGSIIKELGADRPDAYQFTAVELRKECGPQLAELPNVVRLYTGVDFLTWNARDAVGGELGLKLGEHTCSSSSYFNGAITNPAFPITMEVLSKCLTICDHVIMLQRVNWLGCGTNNGKNDFLRSYAPDVYVLPDRVQFLIDGKYPRYPEGAVDNKGKSIAGRKMPGDSIEYAWFYWGPKDTRRRESGRIRNLGGTSLEERQAG